MMEYFPYSDWTESWRFSPIMHYVAFLTLYIYFLETYVAGSENKSGDVKSIQASERLHRNGEETVSGTASTQATLVNKKYFLFATENSITVPSSFFDADFRSVIEIQLPCLVFEINVGNVLDKLPYRHNITSMNYVTPNLC